jgi:hypothetical protein
MNSRTTRRFRELFARLPAHVQLQAREAYRLFVDDPVTFSARVGIGYRAVAALDGNTWVWFWIGSHADYDKLLGEM